MEPTGAGIAPLPTFRLLGVRIHAVQIPDAVRIMASWVRSKTPSRYVTVTGMHGVSQAQRDPLFRRILNSADLCVADGAPVMLAGRLAGHPGMRRRVYGPELMVEFLRESEPMALRHFFYGGAPGVAEELARRLSDRFPGMILAGTDSPPFGPLPPEEPAESLRKIRDARPDVLWVGLGTPKQERWMSARRAALRVPLLVGVGAAFDIHAGRLAQAPAWMREHGMEWFHRLLAEPRRLWKRYLLEGGEFGLRMLFTLFTGGLRSV